MLTFNYVLVHIFFKTTYVNLIHLCVPHGLRFNLRYIKSNTKKVIGGEKSTVWPNWFRRQFITDLSTFPSSNIFTKIKLSYPKPKYLFGIGI